jgi:hypothetical protein
VAMTAVAHPLRMLSTAVAMAVVGPGARSGGTATGMGRGM